MQTLAQFVAYWSGRYCDFDGYYGGQCVDEADFYIRDVWGLPPFFVNGAVDLFGHRPDAIEWIANEVGNAKQFPRPGDLIIWHLDAKIGTGVNGHVAVCVRASGTSFVSLDENWPLGARPHLVTHDYEGVRGWGRRRPPVIVKPPPKSVPAPISAPAPSPSPAPLPAPVPPLPLPLPPEPLPLPPDPLELPSPPPPLVLGFDLGAWLAALWRRFLGRA